jgi:outer membrane protein insertion porin family
LPADLKPNPGGGRLQYVSEERNQAFMALHRLRRLITAPLCVLALAASLSASQQSSSPASTQQPPTQKKTPSPFETVPGTETTPAPATPAPQQAPGAKPAFEAPKPTAPEAAAPAAVEKVVEAIEFRGNRRVMQDALRALVFTKKGDKFDEESLRRDFMALWNSGRFDDLRLEVEPGHAGLVVRFVVTERRIIRTIKYPGAKSVTVSEILDRFKERKVGLSVESQYDDAKVQRARVVLQEFLAERGRQFATVTPELRQIPPSSVELLFNVNEGPKVKVGLISFQGNKVFKARIVQSAMKNLRPIGIPHSILLENMFAKAYDSAKLDEDKDRIRDFYQQRGYFTARAVDSKVTMRDVGSGKFRIPLLYSNKEGKRADIMIAVEEGRRYHLNKINFVGVKFFRTPEALMRPLFGMSEGDIFSTNKLKKGMENLRKLYGQFGFIDFVPEPDFAPIANSDKLDLTLTVDEGKQFFVRRIDFSGNTTTRDKVIRRELLIDEGDLYSTQLWDLSILRLNQLGYFEVLKENEAADIKRDTRTNTVDITLKVKERGKNSIGLQGGVSGIAGTFIGFNYSTNNFLGMGETLSIESQLGDRIRSVNFGFTEPYFMDKPIQVGFTVYLQRFNYDQGREVSLATGRDLSALYSNLGSGNLLNYVSNGHGATVFASYPLRRSFARLGLTLGYDISNIRPLTTAANQYFNYLNYENISGTNNTLTGIKTAKIAPSYTYNTVDHPITPSRGKSIFLSTSFAGKSLGGNVNMIEPTAEFKYFRHGFEKGHVIGFHVLGRYVTGYGGRVAPPQYRFYMGGENDIRGFDSWGISPIVFVPSSGTMNVLNADGSARTQRIVVGGKTVTTAVTQTIPVYQLLFPGGDTQVVSNTEYRIPIVGPVTLAFFGDIGVNRLSMSDQLRMNPDRVTELNNTFPAAAFDNRAVIAAGTQKIRASTGLELQVMMPVVNAPFRVYYAYNPSTLRQYIEPPIVADRSYFNNEASYQYSRALFGQAIRWYERRTSFRFTIGRTF